MNGLDAFAALERAGWSEAGKARAYHALVGQITARVAEPLLNAAGVVAGTRVLDVATGPGYVAAAAARRGVSAVGVDVSEEMLALAKGLHPGVDFHAAEAERLPFPDGEFDAVVAGFLLHHLPRPELALVEFARVLRPHGRVAVSTWDAERQARIVGLLADAIREAEIEPPADAAAGPSREELARDETLDQLLRGAGFDQIVLSTVAFSQRVESLEELWEGLLAGTVRTAATVRAQGEEGRHAIRTAFDRLAEQLRSGDGYDVPVSVRIAVGRKA